MDHKFATCGPTCGPTNKSDVACKINKSIKNHLFLTLLIIGRATHELLVGPQIGPQVANLRPNLRSENKSKHLRSNLQINLRCGPTCGPTCGVAWRIWRGEWSWHGGPGVAGWREGRSSNESASIHPSDSSAIASSSAGSIAKCKSTNV